MTDSSSNAGGLVGQRLGKYELLALLALGGTAEIYLARIAGVAGFEKYVVVKCLHDHLADDNEFVRMFLDEARLGAQLTHSNIVQTLELGEQQGRYYMVMEYLAGMSTAVIARKASERLPGGRLPVDLVLYLMAQSCAGLHYAHNRTDASSNPLNVVHRDVSPQNLVVTFDGMLKVVDFGIAKAAVRETQTQSGTIKGKFAYMSPEQCLGGDMDHRTDIFALGIITHEFLTGRRLFKRENAYDTYHAILECKVAPPSQTNHELDPVLDGIVLKALARDVKDRYQTAEEYADALMGVLHRRGKSVNAAAVSQFFDKHFATEVSDHGQRMRALITGRQASATTTMDEYWEDLDDKKADSEKPAKGSTGPIATIDVDLGAVRPEESSEVSVLDGDLLEEEEDDHDSGGATRIELNPLERVRQTHSELRARRNDSNDQPAAHHQVPGDVSGHRDADDNVKTLIADRSPQVDQAIAQAMAQQGSQSAQYGNLSQGAAWNGGGSFTPSGGMDGLAPHHPQGGNHLHHQGPFPGQGHFHQGQGYPMANPYAQQGFAIGTQEHAAKPPAWLLALVFVSCVGLGLGATLLIAWLV